MWVHFFVTSKTNKSSGRCTMGWMAERAELHLCPPSFCEGRSKCRVGWRVGARSSLPPIQQPLVHTHSSSSNHWNQRPYFWRYPWYVMNLKWESKQKFALCTKIEIYLYLYDKTYKKGRHEPLTFRLVSGGSCHAWLCPKIQPLCNSTNSCGLVSLIAN